MSDEKVMNRWLVVVGAILIQFCLGAIYAWSVFTKLLTAEGGTYGFTAKQTAWVFSAGLASFAVVMVMVGPWAKKNPRRAAALGGIVLGIGYILGGFFGSSFAAQFVCIGLIGGAGIGIAYVVPIAVGVKWFPDKKGMIAGLGVAGFGFGATLWVKLAGSWFGGLLNTTALFGLPGVQSVFVIYGIIFLVVVLIGSTVMVDPPEGYKPEGWEPPAPTSGGGAVGTIEMTSREMLRTPQYFMLLFMFIGSALAGLMVIYCIRLFGIDALQASGVAADAKTAGMMAGTAMAWYAILNGLGRIIWGMASDKIGRKLALFLMCLIQGIVMMAFLKMGGSQAGLIAGACIIGFNFGGNFALFPTATADFFGAKNLGPNYGWVFLAYGVAGIAGPQVAGIFKDAAKTSGAGVGAWTTPFMVAGVACLIAAAIALCLKPPAAPAAAAVEEKTEE
ncbi:MAG: OFA family MFS transporter [Lentisphaerae bacterium]|jgi:MFS transporter, OFA family, oxalate/formate antiporter|nr:OFA family MFS transporter [Lentisphaerota bacterium]MBT4818520.1 OFA family MFS transporter [Lentisphaerota bacterium]MBT5610345.1 OFA family MFS transporter [Lentisphaerota bacterium]MBT7056173.1 OFA family MFS transporter [Lentisphaerota bacterium]MBT7841905.1 OFA family MFS transporter [Lentisphaerota bacterium]